MKLHQDVEKERGRSRSRELATQSAGEGGTLQVRSSGDGVKRKGMPLQLESQPAKPRCSGCSLYLCTLHVN